MFEGSGCTTMNFLKKNYKLVCATLIILILMELAVVYYMLNRFHELYIPAADALSAAMTDAGIEEGEAANTSVKLGHKSGEAWYNVRFEADGTVYVYRVNAEDGAILSSSTE